MRDRFYSTLLVGGDTVFYPEFGENLKQLRKSRSMTQEEFGSHVGISKAVISKYETGIGFPSLDILKSIAEYYGVTTDYLLGASENKTVNLTGLTDSQIEVVHRVITEFQRANKQ